MKPRALSRAVLLATLISLAIGVPVNAKSSIEVHNVVFAVNEPRDFDAENSPGMAVACVGDFSDGVIKLYTLTQGDTQFKPYVIGGDVASVDEPGEFAGIIVSPEMKVEKFRVSLEESENPALKCVVKIVRR